MEFEYSTAEDYTKWLKNACFLGLVNQHLLEYILKFLLFEPFSEKSNYCQDFIIISVKVKLLMFEDSVTEHHIVSGFVTVVFENSW